jgi:hypothetical protein
MRFDIEITFAEGVECELENGTKGRCTVYYLCDIAVKETDGLLIDVNFTDRY